MGAIMTETLLAEMEEIRNLIAETFAKRNFLKQEMEKWYESHTNKRFDRSDELITIDSTLSQLDSHYKRLWDYHYGKSAKI